MFFLTAVLLLSLITVVPVLAADNPEVEIGNITRIKGQRINQLIGYGIVVGLNGSGDSNRSQATLQSVSNMLQNFGVNVTDSQITSQNIAAVMVTAELPAVAHNGDQIPITVSSIGDADSLQGGTLLLTPLQAPNGDIYASAQGAISVGGYSVGDSGNSEVNNHPTVGQVPGGALIEKEINTNLNSDNLTYILANSSYKTASNIVNRINNTFGAGTARALNSSTINIKMPDNFNYGKVSFIAELNSLKVTPAVEARVVIDERTGTVVFSHNVHISTVAVAHGNLSVSISTQEEVSQPESFTEGETKVTEDVQIEVDEGESGNMTVVSQKSTIDDLVTALNAIGATPRDIISIIQKIDAAGALHAELVIQ